MTLGSQVCNSSDTLFPFSPMVEECAVCEAVFHRWKLVLKDNKSKLVSFRDCFRSVTLCPRCARREERQAVERENWDLLTFQLWFWDSGLESSELNLKDEESVSVAASKDCDLICDPLFTDGAVPVHSVGPLDDFSSNYYSAGRILFTRYNWSTSFLSDSVLPIFGRMGSWSWHFTWVSI